MSTAHPVLAEVLLARLLQHWAARDAADHAVLAPLADVTLRNWNGLAAGGLRPVFDPARPA